ncbi:hypothetical protein [Clostridium baratii]|uniref:hypothetical protein n=1 Tax=Clostridium baratii TaxID=1561 RepID=UPI0030CDFF5E
MSDFRQQLIHDLAKEYTFKNFDFKKSPDELLMFYQETSDKLFSILEKQDAEIFNEISDSWLNED